MEKRAVPVKMDGLVNGLVGEDPTSITSQGRPPCHKAALAGGSLGFLKPLFKLSMHLARGRSTDTDDDFAAD